ncbi:hypothetical protein Tco_0940823 [Tanacetum coccineum]|uniref:Integrase, catalytic region, zinc finger, CCHC-type, peptidase aspartic, catalytic n=1 Tax=Tanacetum coccineum TaxID=301880 RepID=A0ABQ5DPZ6_9ASTR
MTTLPEHIIVAGVENRPPMLEKSMYDSWASRIRLFIKGEKHGRMTLDSIDNGPLVYPTGETLYEYYWIFSQLINDIHTIGMTMQQVQATIQDGRVIVQQVQGQTQIFAGTRNRGYSTILRGNYAAGQPRVMKCYNCQGEGHMAASQILDEEQLAFLADPGINEALVAQQTIPQNLYFQTEDLDVYDSDCDDISSAKAVLMANLSSCDPVVLFELLVDSVPVDKNNLEIKIKQLSIDNDQLLNQIMSQDIVHIAVNSVDICDMNKSCVDECSKCLELETELIKKKDFIEKESVENLNLNAQLQEKVFAIATLKNKLRKLKGKNVVDSAVSKPIATISPGMFMLDIEPISHRLKNNRDAHEVYLDKTIEYTDTLRGFVECARKQNLKIIAGRTNWNKDKKVRFAKHVTSPSNIPKQTDSRKTKDSNKPLLPSKGVNSTTSASGSKPSGNTKKNRITRPPSSNQKNKVEEHPRKVKSSLNKTNSISEPINFTS